MPSGRSQAAAEVTGTHSADVARCCLAENLEAFCFCLSHGKDHF